MTNKKNKGTGAGGSRTNLNGINFEEQVYLKKWLEESGFDLKSIKVSTSRSEVYEIFKNDKLVGYYGRQGMIYRVLKMVIPNLTDEHIKKIMSKKINPDGFIINLLKRKLIIFEKKWQQSSGSVDEKIQTAPFKVDIFERLLKGFDFKVEYHYILSDYFKQSMYRNVREYYENNKQICIWTENLDLEKLNISEFLK